MFAATVMELAACLGQKRVQEEFTLKGTEGSHPRGDHLEDPSGLLLVPGAGPRRELLQAHGNTQTMTGDTAGVALTRSQEDRLTLVLKNSKSRNDAAGVSGAWARSAAVAGCWVSTAATSNSKKATG